MKSSIGGLVVTRRAGQKVSVNNGEIIIEVVEIQGKAVRIAFQAHKEIKIERLDDPLKISGPRKKP